jgi:hypothetical protein
MLIPPPLTDAKPGDPITSQNWNNILVAIRTIYDALNKTLGTLTVHVKNRANGNPIPDALVTVIPTGDPTQPVRTGLYAGSNVNAYHVTQLAGGTYGLVVEAKDFNPETRPITMDQAGGSQNLTVELLEKPKDALFLVPNVFGLPLNEAIEIVRRKDFQIGRIIDSHGKEIAPAAQLADEVKLASVLNQVPDPETLMEKNAAIQLHISARAEFAERVRVPDLRGLSLEEAKAKLEASRLVLGETSNVGRT